MVDHEVGGAAKRVTIVVADDSDDYRMLLGQSFAFDDRVEVVAEAADAPTTLSAVEKEQPDVLLLDLNLSDGESLDLIPDVAGRAPRTQVVVLSGFPAASRQAAAIAAGADLYLDKDAKIDEIADEVVRLAASREEDSERGGAV